MGAISVLLRTHNLLSLPIFTDEAIYLHWASDIWEQRTREALMIPAIDDGKQPLFMWLAGGAMQAIDDPVLAGRLVSALAGVASTLGVFLAGRFLSGSTVGLIASALYAVAPFTLMFDRMALVDALLTTTAVWALCLSTFITGQTRSGREATLSGVGLGIVLGAAIWTKMTAVFILPFPLLALVLVRRRSDLRRAGLALAVAYGVFGLFALALALAPGAANIIHKTSSFSASTEEVLALPVQRWASNLMDYWTWVQAYLPAPLYWLVLLAIPWGIAIRPRVTLLLLACWAVYVGPSALGANFVYTTRYVIPSAIPMLLLAAIFVDWAATRAGTIGWPGPARGSDGPHLPAAVAGAVMVAVLAAPSVGFDLQLLADPAKAAFAGTDRWQYVEGGAAGYGFAETVEKTLERAREHGGNVIVLSDHFHGLPYDGLAVYLKGVPGVYHYVDGHIFQGGTGIVEAWWPHQVPLLVVGSDARNDLDTFEQNVPEAEKIGVFPNPHGKYSFRLYEIDLPRLAGRPAAASR